MEELASLTKRVAYLEREVRRIPHTIDGVEERTESRLQSIEEHLNRQDKALESIDKRFEHIYGILADMQANDAEMRNLLASIVQKLG